MVASIDEVEDALYAYPACKKHIANMRHWFMNRLRRNPEEERVQEGTTGDPTFAIVRDLMTDPGYVAAVLLCDGIEAALEQLGPTARQVIEETYFKPGRRTQDGIAMRCKLSRSRMYEIRREALEYIAEVLAVSGSIRRKLQRVAEGDIKVVI